MSGTKVCRWCGVEKPIDGFYRYKRNADGRANVCRECDREAQRKRREADPERYREYGRKSYYKHHDARLEQKREHYRANRDDYIARSKKWHEEHRDIMRAYKKAYDKRRNAQKALEKLRGMTA
jgi:hypothetical protein